MLTKNHTMSPFKREKVKKRFMATSIHCQLHHQKMSKKKKKNNKKKRKMKSKKRLSFTTRTTHRNRNYEDLLVFENKPGNGGRLPVCSLMPSPFKLSLSHTKKPHDLKILIFGKMESTKSMQACSNARHGP